MPLKLSELRNLFKLFQNDVGLLAAQYAQEIAMQILTRQVNINYGAIYENFVAQELKAHGWDLRYFNSKKQGEVDFVIEEGTKVLPIEVKSGKDYQRHSALTNLLTNKEYGITKALVLNNENMKQKGNVLYAPIYMTMFIQKKRVVGEMHYVLNMEGLK